jgi:hypothetical protein
MFGDNKSVVDSSMIPHSQLNKRHTALSYHRVREAICADTFKFYHIYGTENPSFWWDNKGYMEHFGSMF